MGFDEDDVVIVHIKNFDRFNPRKDCKRPTWLRLEHDIFYDPKFYDFDDSEFRAWLFLLCEASRSNATGKVTVNLEHAYRVGRVQKESMHRAIEKLVSRRIVTVHSCEGRFVTFRDSHTTDVTNVTNERNTIAPSAKTDRARELNFDQIYQEYPRKRGKLRGLRICRAQIKTPEDYENLKTALARFLDNCKSTGVEKKFIPYFSTFMSTWREWLDPETGQSVDFSVEKSKHRVLSNTDLGL